MTEQKIELLAPGGDVEAIKAAIVAGANAVYCGLDTFNARSRAANLSFDALIGVIKLAHQFDCKVFLTMNILILEREIPPLLKLLNQLVNTGIDGIIVQDLGLLHLLQKYFPSLDIHASTQLTTHNEGQILFLAKMGVSRVNLSRELTLGEIKSLTNVAHQQGILIEVFVHGALCISFSGQCYASSVSSGNSGNRGRCSQACRDEYEITAAGNKFPLNLKDNSAYFDLPELVDAGVDSLKIEGRIKGAPYVHTVVDTWRKQIEQFAASGKLLDDAGNLYKVFNRDFTNAFLKGNFSKNMFIDNPRDNSFKHANEQNNAISVVQIEQVQKNLAQEKNAISALVAAKIKHLSIAKTPLAMVFSGKCNEPLTVIVKKGDKRFTVKSEMLLTAADNAAIDPAAIEKRFKSFKNSGYDLQGFDFNGLDSALSLPFKEITVLKHKVAFLLNDSSQPIPPVTLPALKQHAKNIVQPSLSILISDKQDLHLCDVSDAEVYFKLPESFKKNCTELIELFLQNPKLIPWFPAVLIGKDYQQAVNFLQQVKPQRIVSNNSGIAHQAAALNIDWIAGPFLNTTNSYALKALQEELNCCGAFISNEINREQIKHIRRPENFKLLYSIYHPILMMTSRLCFFQQTVGCNKTGIDEGCMLRCKKATTVTNVKGFSFAVDKQKGGYPSIYHEQPFLNFDVVAEFSDLFDQFFIDLTNIGAGTKIEQDKTILVNHFKNLLAGSEDAKVQLAQMIPVSTHAQYIQGI